MPRLFQGRLLIAMIAVAVALGCQSAAMAEVFTLENGMQLEGAAGKIGSFAADPNKIQAGGGAKVNTIIVVDDELRRVYVPMYQVKNTSPSLNSGMTRFKIPQRVATSGKAVVSVGPILKTTPFDEWGRRILTMSTAMGNIDLVQGITEISPRFMKVEGLLGRGSLVWNMRIATSSLNREQLSRIVLQHLDRKDPDQRVQLVQLYIQADRIQDANAELKSLLVDFPNLKELNDTVRSLTQVGSQRLLREVEQRDKAGQPGLALNMLTNFPSEGVAGETLLRVREYIKKYDDVKQQAELTLKRLQATVAEIKDEKRRAAVDQICDEINAELNIHNFDRLADFARLFDDQTLSAEQKLALAISGWLMGNGQGVDNLGLSLSLVEVRNLAKQYLVSKRKLDRDSILKSLRSEEGATAAYLAKILAHLKPPLETAHAAGEAVGKREEAAEQPVGLHKHTIPGLQEDPEINYHVQLPPEYDPYRRYPVIVTLNGAGTNPLHQVEWWAGSYNATAQMRYGQAGRHGYIVIAPEWTREHQRKYEYSAREHAAVLYSLRDACRRYSIDTDRVFLSGHSMGGDAAWDIGLSHPDLFAGVVPIVAEADKYISHYAKNGQLVPMYFVCGQMDGAKREQNAPEWDRYLVRPGYDVMVVEYLGRGHEHFYEEVQNIFDWMNRHRRDFALTQQKDKEFTAMTMRPWDTFFFWVEIDKLPPTASILPVDFQKVDKARAIETTGKILANNGLSVSTGAGKATVYFSPDVIDLSNAEKPPFITIRGKRFLKIVPDLEVMLEDARSRADRLHPFWGKIEY